MAPLEHRRILVTRAAGQASALVSALETRGATAIQIPTIEISHPRSWCALDAALASIRSFDWLIFTSANAVDAYAQRARTLKLQPQARRVAVIGRSTEKAVLAAGVAVEVDLLPEQAVAESLLEALLPHAAGAKMLLVRAAVARDILPLRLEEAGALVTVAEAYRTVVPADSVTTLRNLIAGEPPDAITFTSASTAQNLVALLEQGGISLPTSIALASIGPITSQAMRELNLEPSVEAREASIDSLVEALAHCFSGAR